tara:strand:- start:1044 stop:1532 length:489 start_codon:yes stop_codon:yes gene_type:complete
MPLDFDSNDVDVSVNRDYLPIPDGKYCVQVQQVTDQAKTSSTGNDYEAVNVQFRICTGEFTNRRMFKSYIYAHPSEAAMKIGKEGLASLFKAQGGVGNVTVSSLESSETCVEMVLKTKPAQNGYDARQEVTYINVCKQPCADGGCPSPSPSNGDAGGDIWNA